MKKCCVSRRRCYPYFNLFTFPQNLSILLNPESFLPLILTFSLEDDAKVQRFSECCTKKPLFF